MEIEVPFTQNQKSHSRSGGLCPTEDFRAWTNMFGIPSLDFYTHRGAEFHVGKALMCELQLFAYLIPTLKVRRGGACCMLRGNVTAYGSNLTFKALEHCVKISLKVFISI